MGAGSPSRIATTSRWRRRAATMVQVDKAYRCLPPPLRAAAWLPVLYAAAPSRSTSPTVVPGALRGPLLLLDGPYSCWKASDQRVLKAPQQSAQSGYICSSVRAIHRPSTSNSRPSHPWL